MRLRFWVAAILRCIMVLAAIAATATGATGSTSELLDIVNSDAIETDIAFSPDGKVMLFSRREGEWGKSAQRSTVFISYLRNSEWTTPVPAPFSGKYVDSDPFVPLDGRFVYFISTRPSPDKLEPDPDVWRLAITAEGFGRPERLPEPINSPGVEYSPVTATSGALYFASTREGGLGQGDLYRAAATGKGFGEPENLGPSVNSEKGEWNLYVSPAEDLLIFESSGRPDNVGNGSGDLYATLKVDGEWALTRNLRHINSLGSDLMPRVFPHEPNTIYYAQADIGEQPPAVDVTAGSRAELLAHFDRLLIVNRSAHEVCAVTVPGFVRLKCTSTTGFRPYDSGYGPHEIVVSPDHEIAYVPNYGMFPRRHHRLIHNEITHWYKKRGGSIANLNLDTVSAFHNSAVRSLCRRPHGVATDGARLWVTCEEEGAILELKARDWSYDNVLRVRKLGQKGAHQLKLSQDGKLLAATNIAFGTVSLIDLQTERTSTLEVGMRPEAMAFAPDGQRLFVLNERSNSLSVVDIEARKVVRTLPTGGDSPSSIAVAAGAKEIWISHNASPLVNPGSIPDLTILDLVTLQEKQQISLRWRPLTLILSDDEQWVFVSVPRRNEVWAYDTATRERRAVIPNMMDADGLAFVPAR